jgi:hypothetical protein
MNDTILKDFLIHLANSIDIEGALTTSQHKLILEHYSKHKLLVDNKPVEPDDWAWVSLGLLLKSMLDD